VSRLKQLIHEVHRRSLWQVLGIYVVGAWLGYEVIQGLTEGMGLPSWFPSLAVVLFITGLPVVVATAIVQEGVGHREPDASSGEVETTSGGTPIPPAASAAQPLVGSGARRFLTWRNAIAAGVVAFALWGAIGTTWLLFADRTTPASIAAGDPGDMQIESIAVLAFDDMSPDQDQEYFSDGISEEILDALAKVDGLRVAARSSSFSFKGTNTDVREVGQKLGVDAVLEGSVRKSENRLRITAQLVNAEDGFHLWSDSYDREMADVFAVQEEIAGEIVAALGFAAPENAPPAGSAAEATIAAHDYYLLGLHRWNNRRSGEDLEAALGHFEQAAREDSLFARAHAAMALIYSVWPQWDSLYSRSDAIRLGKAEAARAAELDPSLIEPNAALCQIATWNEWEWTEALERCQRTVASAPNYATGHQWLAELFLLLGRNDEALVAVSRARELDPLTVVPSNILAFSHNQSGDYEAAIAQSRLTLEIDPEARFGIFHDLIARFMSGRQDGLEEGFLKWAETPEDSVRHSEFIALYLEADTDEGKRKRAVEMIPELSLMNDFEATLYLLLGEPDRALDWLEGMYARHAIYLPLQLQRKIFEPLYDDPRFIELKRKTGLDRPPAATD
jgi:TolB-like protein/Tfp pilus assembly protein PilF